MVSKQVRFYAGKHTYWIGNKKLKSVTQTVNQIFPEFNAKEISRKIAKGFKYRNWQKQKKGIKVSSIEKKKGTMKYWREKWKESAEHGTRVHSAIEEFILLGDSKMARDKCCITQQDIDKYNAFLEWYGKTIPNLDKPLLMSELILYNEKLGYAGTVDLMVVDDSGKRFIIDWKTNEKLTQPGKPLKEPFNHLDDSKLCRYALQLSFYAYLEKLKGNNIDNLVVVHLQPNNYNEYKIEYLEDDVKKLIEVDKEWEKQI